MSHPADVKSDCIFTAQFKCGTCKYSKSGDSATCFVQVHYFKEGSYHPNPALRLSCQHSWPVSAKLLEVSSPPTTRKAKPRELIDFWPGCMHASFRSHSIPMKLIWREELLKAQYQVPAALYDHFIEYYCTVQREFRGCKTCLWVSCLLLTIA
jgi:hypothetical protein